MGRQMASLTSMGELSATQMMTNAQPVMSALVTIKKVPPKVPRHAKPSQNQRRRMASLTSMLEKSATQMTTNAQPVMSALVTRNPPPPMVPRHAKPSQNQRNLLEPASLNSMLEKSVNQLMTNAQLVMSALVTIKKVPPKVPRHAKPSQNQRRQMASLTSMLEKSAT